MSDMAVVCATDIEELSVEWIWEPYLARGALAINGSDPGSGKSWRQLWIAAQLSRGRWSNGVPLNSLILNQEDDPNYTIIPRLRLMGADMRHVFVENNCARFRGTALIGTLEREITAHDISFVGLDPFNYFIGADVDAFRGNQTRDFTSALIDVLRATRCSAEFVTHLTKGRAPMLMRILGSIDIAGAARIVVGMKKKSRAKHPCGVISLLKCNIAKVDAPNLEYEVTETAGFVLGAATDLEAEDLVEEDNERADGSGGVALVLAEQWLAGRLNGAAVAARTIMEEAREEDISEKTLRRAKASLGVEAYKDGAAWFWRRTGGTGT